MWVGDCGWESHPEVSAGQHLEPGARDSFGRQFQLPGEEMMSPHRRVQGAGDRVGPDEWRKARPDSHQPVSSAGGEKRAGQQGHLKSTPRQEEPPRAPGF